MPNNKQRSLTAKQAVKILEKHGTHTTEEEAEKILDFLYFLGEITVKQYLKDKDKDTNSPNTKEDATEPNPVKRKVKRRPPS